MNEIFKNSHKYDDIIHLPHHQSKVRKQMSVHDRAAQFAPFSALTGHKAAIQKTARHAEEMMEPETEEFYDSI